MHKAKPILCLDFDGVIHSYTSGWQGAGRCDDPPVVGTLEYLIEATKHFRVMIYSSRSKSFAGRIAMRRYMRDHFAASLTFSPDHDHDWLYEAVEFPWFKPPALITIDDRALCFTGNWSDFGPAKLFAFKPWNKRPVGGEAVHSPDKREGSRDELKNDLPNPTKEA